MHATFTAKQKYKAKQNLLTLKTNKYTPITYTESLEIK